MKDDSGIANANIPASKGALVVIGAGAGLGAAAACRFGREGHPVGLIARDAERLEQLAARLTTELPPTITAPATATADVTDADALSAALGALRERLGPPEVVLFSPRPSLEWIKPVLDTGPQDVANALALSVVAATAAVRTVTADMCRRGRGTLLFTTGGAAVEPHRDRAVSGIAYAAESAYVRMLHDALGDAGVYAAQLTVVGPIGPGARHEPDAVADELWQLHTRRDQPLLVLR
ncbi:SDR family NAD(P)-dependent oxidoreductase [Streptomyces sp. ASQP_92]|uniref:SDR family NAD(P)-dependent oxidoreductase n=1 Tax=Streptomyces sp. ASQP_92 TaxID=2979116 RepID=UPI0021C0FC22|nr:SDR family NAD(P)-dependent oxidoreductase [Streptomyces sp. ASQP_92]MCT9089788.1 SDR family NAD(P)-dependent oxidoreductase [Streptomyces sp. ASQP_92]